MDIPLRQDRAALCLSCRFALPRRTAPSAPAARRPCCTKSTGTAQIWAAAPARPSPQVAAAAGARGGGADRPSPSQNTLSWTTTPKTPPHPSPQVAGGVKAPFLNRAIDMPGKHREGIDVGVPAVITAGERAMEPGLHRLADQRDQAELQFPKGFCAASLFMRAATSPPTPRPTTRQWGPPRPRR